MLAYETKYLHTTESILDYGDFRSTRNGHVKSVFYKTLRFNMSYGEFPVITSRKMNVDGILGEYAAIIRGPKNIKDFQKWGCNYWNEFGDSYTGDLRIDYGNLWTDYDGFNQVEELINNIKHHPHDRRLLIDAWKPTNISKSSLPCCHFLYQFYVEDVHLDLCWYQRSGDWMIGVPSDMIFAATLLACIASICNKQPRWINMTVGDAHIYKEHFDQAREQTKRVCYNPPKYVLARQEKFTDFQPVDLKIIEYKNKEAIKYDLKK